MVIDVTELDVCAMATTSSMANTTTITVTVQQPNGKWRKPTLSQYSNSCRL